MDNLRTQLALLPEYGGSHMLLTLSALGAGIALSIPLALAASQRPLMQWMVLSVASILQTIPGLAMLAFMFLLIGRLGFWPAATAITLYSMLPMLRNTVTGLRDIDPNLVEAARGLGMTDGQVLMRVRLPLAMPVIIAGIRTASVWVVGIATLGTPIGATCLGNYIFSGLQTQNHTAVLVGSVAAAVLAITLDQLIGLLQRASERRSRPLGIAATVGLGLLVLVGVSPTLADGRRSDARPVAVIGAKNFSEQFVLAALMAQRLEQAGFRAELRTGLGSTVVFEALAKGEIDCYVDYSGTIWANHMQRDEIRGADAVLAEMTEWLAETRGIVSLGRLGFENAYAFAMRGDDAAARGIVTLEDLSRAAGSLRAAGDYEFFSRPEWEAVRDAYGIAFQSRTSLDSTLMYEGLASGQVDVIAAFSSDGRIAAYDLAVLEDPRQALPPYDAVLLLSPRAARNAALREALLPLLDAIDDDLMRNANKWVDLDRVAVDTVARRLDEILQGRADGNSVTP